MSFGISVRNGVALGLGTVPALGNRGVPGPSLDLNFLSGTLDGSVTFTRSTTATYYNSLGLVTSAAINAARFDYDPTTLQIKGLLMEESRANLLNFSQTFATAGGANNNWADTNLTRTSTTELSPDGTNNALQITASAANGTLISTTAIGTSASRTLSVFLRRVSGTGDIQYTLNNGATCWVQNCDERRFNLHLGRAA
jgi:hypothetical protein